MTFLLSDLAKRVDARSSRSRQRKLGPSSVGTCRRRAGYEHHGVRPSNPENVTGLAAIVGTWVHHGALETIRKETGALIETVVEDETMRGHIDALFLTDDLLDRLPAKYHRAAYSEEVCTVDDLKTRRDASMIDFVRNRGPKRAELYQVHLYAHLLRTVGIKPLQRQKALADLGPIPVERVRLRYFARTGVDGAEYVHEQAYDPAITAEALRWLEEVYAAGSPDDLPRDEDGPGVSIICDNCPFRTACWGEAGEDPEDTPQSRLVVTDADLAGHLAAYADAAADEADAKKRKTAAREALRGQDPAIYATDEEAASGFKLGWSGGRASDPGVDVAAMVELFEEAGLAVPYLEPRPSPRSIRVTRWALPEKACPKADDAGTPCLLKRGHSGACTGATALEVP